MSWSCMSSYSSTGNLNVGCLEHLLSCNCDGNMSRRLLIYSSKHLSSSATSWLLASCFISSLAHLVLTASELKHLQSLNASGKLAQVGRSWNSANVILTSLCLYLRVVLCAVLSCRCARTTRHALLIYHLPTKLYLVRRFVSFLQLPSLNCNFKGFNW